MGYTDRELLSVHVALQLTSVLSLLGSIAVTYHILFVDVRKQVQNRINLFLTISDFFLAVATVFAQYPVNGSLASSDGTVSVACVMQAWGIQTFFIASALWKSAMALNVLLVLRFRIRIDQLPKFDWGYACVIFSATMITASVAAYRGVFGPAGLWCAVSESFLGLRVGLLYAPVWVLFFFNICIYGWIGYTLHMSQRAIRSTGRVPSSTMPVNTKSSEVRSMPVSSGSKDPIARYISQVSFLMLAFFIQFTPGSLNRILNMVGINQYVFLLIQSLTQPLGGFLSAMMYFVNKTRGVARTRQSTTSAPQKPSVVRSSHRPIDASRCETSQFENPIISVE
ncbi:hypothetical protein SeLEV6574_g04853 [Synchytrium endobioticum]|uniref:G-protein coupled receptors family 2 profile 2 domain-containing protein n=1 Tax=Synchytrium endobioticum TaxID=286115 RepID=A0A507CXN9_9FUNG|nr:hypothetical protein SeLEV6574_g04853 [Synchytrium endobioticum]